MAIVDIAGPRARMQSLAAQEQTVDRQRTVFELEPGKGVVIRTPEGDVTVTFLRLRTEHNGPVKARIGITADPAIGVMREELLWREARP